MANLFYENKLNDEEAKKWLLQCGNDYPPITYECFGEWDEYYQGDNDNFYIGFPAHENIIKLIDEVNSNFRNIKITPIASREFYLDTDENSLYDDDLNENDGGNFNYLLFRVELNSDYIKESKYILVHAMAEFLRVACPYYRMYRIFKSIKSNFINQVLLAQATDECGGWICCDPSNNFDVDRETFNKFDNIELINSITKGNINFGRMPIINRLIRILDSGRPNRSLYV
jgi:hypothetical protein